MAYKKIKILGSFILIIVGLFSLVMALLLGYDVIVVVGQVDGNLFSSNWNTIFDIDSGFGHGLSIIAFFMMSAVSFSEAINLTNDAKEVQGDALVSQEVVGGKE